MDKNQPPPKILQRKLPDLAKEDKIVGKVDQDHQIVVGEHGEETVWIKGTAEPQIKK